VKSIYFAALHLSNGAKEAQDVYLNPTSVAAVMPCLNPNRPDEAPGGTDIVIAGSGLVYSVTERVDEVLHLLASSIGRLPT
jgi:hypothetical protein